MNYNPQWSPYGPPPMYQYPPQHEVRYVPIPTNPGSKDDAVSILKKELKELKRKNEPKKEEKKPDDSKKTRTFTYLECVAITFMSGPFIMLVYGGIIFTTAKVIKSLI